MNIFINKCAVRELVSDKGANLFNTDIKVTGSLSNNFNYHKVTLLMLGIGRGISKGHIIMLRGIKVV